MINDPEIQRNVRRTVGIAALKRIRRIVDADNEIEAGKQRWARRLGIVRAGRCAGSGLDADPIE